MPFRLEVLELLIAGNDDGARRFVDFSIPEGWSDEEHWLIEYRARQLRERPNRGPWLLRAIVLHVDDSDPRSAGEVWRARLPGR